MEASLQWGPNDPRYYVRTAHMRLMREMGVSSFLLCKAAQIRSEFRRMGKNNEMSITRASKLIACYSQDWRSLASSNYPPLFVTINNPYGKVPILPRGTIRKSVSYIYDLEGWGSNSEKYWTLSSDGPFRQVSILKNHEDLADQLINQTWAEGGGFGEVNLLKIESFAEIYGMLGTTDLNILASLRTIRQTRDCLRYANAIWQYELGKLTKVISREDPSDLRMEGKKSLVKMAGACQQIERKMKLFKEKQPQLFDTINSFLVEDKLPNKLSKALLKGIIGSIEIPSETHPTWVVLNDIYSTNRTKIYPTTDRLIKEFEISTGTNISKEKEYKEMMKDLKSDPIIPISDYQQSKEISTSSLQNINQLFDYFEEIWDIDNLTASVGTIVGPRPDWEIKDGEDYPEN